MVEGGLVWSWSGGAYWNRYGLDGPLSWNPALEQWDESHDQVYGGSAVAVEPDAWLMLAGTGRYSEVSTFESRADAWIVDEEEELVNGFPHQTASRARIGTGLGREGAGLVFDPVTQRAFLFGGTVGEDADNDAIDDDHSNQMWTIYAPTNRVVPNAASRWPACRTPTSTPSPPPSPAL
jgi:hypothetical protein